MTAMWIALLVALPVPLVWWIRSRFVVVTVNGGSMRPTYEPGDRVLVRRVAAGRVRAGDVVLMASAAPVLPGGEGLGLVKRALAVPGDPVPRERVPALAGAREHTVPPGRVVLVGDHPGSDDSRQYGYFPLADLLGVVVRKLP